MKQDSLGHFQRHLGHPQGHWGLLLALLLLSLAAVPAAASAAAPQADPFRWPVDGVEPALTGAFMEPRAGRFHSGVDIRTGGRRGLPLRAVADGEIRRARCSPQGYGLAIYQRLEDGRTVVYAHLDAFSDDLQAEFTRAWSQSRRYRQDLNFEAGRFPVKKGQLIGWTGATGVGAPHLHFEVRDGGQSPVNPLLHGLPFEDRTPPRIDRFRIIPATTDSRLNGLAWPEEFAPGSRLEASGELLVLVKAADRTDSAPFPIAPLALELWVDGEPVYASVAETFNWSQTGQVELEVWRESETRARWWRLARLPSNDLPGRRGSPQFYSLRIPADKKMHRLEVRARDAAGNESIAALDVLGGSGGGSEGIRTERLGGSERLLLLDAPGDISPKLWPGNTALIPIAPNHWALPWAEVPTLAAVSADGSDGTLSFGDSLRLFQGGRESTRLELSGSPAIWLKAESESLWPVGALRHDLPTHEQPEASGYSWSRSVGKLHSFGASFRKGILLGTYRSLDLAGLGLVRRAPGSRSWSWESEEAPRVWRVGGPGDLALVRDLQEPSLEPWTLEGRLVEQMPRIAPRADRRIRGLWRPAWEPIALKLDDAEGSGFPDDGEGIVAMVDGQPWPARWDPEDQLIWFEWFVSPGAGEHLLEVEATDRAGNSARSELKIELLGPDPID